MRLYTDRLHKFLLVLIFLFSSQTYFAQACDECFQPKIVYFDCDVFVDSIPEGVSPYIFYWPFANAIDQIIANSPDCIAWAPAATATIANLSAGFPNKLDRKLMTAPDGPVKSWDYLIRGSVVSIGDGTYGFGLYLETAPTREKLLSLSVHFTADLASAQQAGYTISTQMLPLLDKIIAFEEEKRAEDTRVARGDLVKSDPREITITPQKTVVDTGETIDVKIKLIDCDGVALAGRSLIFEDSVVYIGDGRLVLGYGTEGGKITQDEAITDDAGFATVQFKAGSEPGMAKIVVWHPYLTPCGHARVYEGNSFIQIEPAPSDLWVLRANVSYQYSMHSDTTKKYDFGGHADEQYHQDFVEIRTTGRVIAVIENMAEDPSKDFSYYSDALDPYSLIVSGSGLMNEFSKYEETIDGTLVNADIRSDNVSGYAEPGASIQFDYNDVYKYAWIGVGIKATGQYEGKMFFHEWSDYGGEYDSYGLSAGGGCDPSYSEGSCSIVKMDTSGYNANYSFSEMSQESSLEGTRHITKNTSMTLSIAPYNSLTSVSEEEYAQLFPKEFSLNQNYPNPFNPVTTISYQLPASGRVVLKVYSILGREVAELVNTDQIRGTYFIPFDASSLASGIYFYSLHYKDKTYSRKMLLMK